MFRARVGLEFFSRLDPAQRTQHVLRALEFAVQDLRSLALRRLFPRKFVGIDENRIWHGNSYLASGPSHAYV